MAVLHKPSGLIKSQVAPGGAPRAVFRPRTGSSSASSLRRVDGGSHIQEGAHKKDKPRVTRELEKLVSETASAKSPAASSSCSQSRGALKQPATSTSLNEVTDKIIEKRLPTRGQTPAAKADVAPTQQIDDDGTAGRLDKHAAILPPWSCTLNPKVRYQPTTLIWKVHDMPQGMANACAALDERRYQPTSADHGLAFRLRDVVPGGSEPTLTRIGRDGKAVPPREGVATPNVDPFKHPTWWGCGPKKDVEQQTSTYEDLGQGFPNDRLTHSIGAPLLDGFYKHANPFMSHFSKRGPSGEIVCDVSVAGKCGPSARDPKLGRGR